MYQTLADCGLPNEKGQSIDPAAFTFDVFYQIYQAICPRYMANEGPMRIQYQCLVPIDVFPEMKLLFLKQNYDVLSPSSYTHISVRDLNISRMGLPILLLGNMWADSENI